MKSVTLIMLLQVIYIHQEVQLLLLINYKLRIAMIPNQIIRMEGGLFIEDMVIKKKGFLIKLKESEYKD